MPELDTDLWLLENYSKDTSSVRAGSHDLLPAILPSLTVSHRPCAGLAECLFGRSLASGICGDL